MGLKEIEMPYPWLKYTHIFLIILTTIILWGCSASAPAVDTTVVVIVVETIPVEVTRMVEITRLVKVTQKVIVTEIVEVPVTITPQLPTETPNNSPTAETPIAVGNTLTSSSVYPTLAPKLQFTPEERGDGWLPFLIENQTSDKLEIVASGPIPFNRVIWNGGVIKVWLREGFYTYSVFDGANLKYTGSFNITNIDKHLLFLRKDKGKFWVP